MLWVLPSATHVWSVRLKFDEFTHFTEATVNALTDALTQYFRLFGAFEQIGGVDAVSCFSLRCLEGVVGGEKRGLSRVVPSRDELFEGFQLEDAASTFTQFINGQNFDARQWLNDLTAAFALLKAAADLGVQETQFDIGGADTEFECQVAECCAQQMRLAGAYWAAQNVTPLPVVGERKSLGD